MKVKPDHSHNLNNTRGERFRNHKTREIFCDLHKYTDICMFRSCPFSTLKGISSYVEFHFLNEMANSVRKILGDFIPVA